MTLSQIPQIKSGKSYDCSEDCYNKVIRRNERFLFIMPQSKKIASEKVHLNREVILQGFLENWGEGFVTKLSRRDPARALAWPRTLPGQWRVLSPFS